jgi:hypothetical protein
MNFSKNNIYCMVLSIEKTTNFVIVHAYKIIIVDAGPNRPYNK